MALRTLQQIATEHAEHLQKRNAGIDRQLRDAEKQKAEAENAIAKLLTERHATSRAPERLAEYLAGLWRENLCPCCWIDDEVRSPLRPADGGTDDADMLKCGVCHKEFPLPVP